MTPEEKKLLEFYRNMRKDDQHAVLKFSEFLYAQQPESTVELAEPTVIEPKEGESVVGALKRLSAAYPMLDKAKMLDQTSTLMSDHVLRGRDKKEVIQEFEKLFTEHYQLLNRESQPNE